MKLNIRSMGVKLWIYFALFAAVMLIILWLLQTVFLNSFYESMKINDISETAVVIARNYGSDDFEATINEIAYKNALLIFVTDLDGEILYNAHYSFRNPMDVFPAPPGADSQLPREYGEFLDRLEESEKGEISYTVPPDRFKGSVLVYGLALPDAALYISAALDPLDSTTAILRTQLIYVIVIALLLSFAIAFFISRKLSRPIVQITATANELAGGNYDICFNKGDYSEIDELADTLNFATTELSKVERLRRELIANISHDFRTPLTMIKAYTEMIRDISGDNKEKRELHLSVIQEEAERLSTLVDDVLGLSLIQSGNETLRRSRVNVSELASGALKRFELMAARDNHSLRSDIAPVLYAYADAARLEQVFYNLIGNSISHGGESSRIEATLSRAGGRIRFELKDTGKGISPEELNLIWDRYHKAGDSGSAVNTGLGLAIVKGVLELHGADFGAESEVGTGSTFWFEIDACAPDDF